MTTAKDSALAILIRSAILSQTGCLSCDIIKVALEEMSNQERVRFVSSMARHFLSEEAIQNGEAYHNVKNLMYYVECHLGVDL